MMRLTASLLRPPLHDDVILGALPRQALHVLALDGSVLVLQVPPFAFNLFLQESAKTTKIRTLSKCFLKHMGKTTI